MVLGNVDRLNATLSIRRSIRAARDFMHRNVVSADAIPSDAWTANQRCDCSRPSAALYIVSRLICIMYLKEIVRRRSTYFRFIMHLCVLLGFHAL